MKAAKLTKRKKVLLFTAYLLFLFTALVGGSEIFLRWKGFTPWQIPEPFKVAQGGSFYQTHPTLGYIHLPGKFTVITNPNFSYNATHLPDTLRITRPLESYKEPLQREEIWMFGDSFTYGWGINDADTYSWLLQERLPAYEFVNFGVDGYGTVQALIQFRDALRTKKPKVVVLAYAGFHDERNSFLGDRRKLLANFNKLGPVMHPYAWLDKQGHLQYAMAQIQYSEFPLARYSALVNFLDDTYNRLEPILYQSHAVSEALVLEMARLARENSAKFLLVGITRDNRVPKMLEFARKNGIPSADISVELSNENTNYPYDGHPNASANRKMADMLEGFLKAELLKTSN